MANEYEYNDIQSSVYENYDVKGASPYEILQMMNSWNKELRMTISNGLEQVETKIELLDGEISLSVKADGIINAINVSKEGVLIDAKHLDIRGLVTFSALTTPGMTVIHGDNIITGTIMAQDILAESFSALIIEGVIIKGGVISSDSFINITTDAYVGNNIYLGDGSNAEKKIVLSNRGYISWQPDFDTLNIYGGGVNGITLEGNTLFRNGFHFSSGAFVNFSGASVIGLTASNSDLLNGLSSSAFPQLASHQQGAFVSFSGSGDMTWVVNGNVFTYRKV